ncbi:hypothetical protein DSO57_1037949 [Entomophthora muscae]|uniref:Uncharacterized protein n=1 Tax=Entomophthora muscae TaxID=34485 RepID=A0ACC2SCD6_9FUNG|nr:hypothetical protein DSO57_1037949 [Entomophthora muscae]
MVSPSASGLNMESLSADSSEAEPNEFLPYSDWGTAKTLARRIKLITRIEGVHPPAASLYPTSLDVIDAA